MPLPRVLTPVRAGALGFTPGRIRTELRHGRWRQLTRGIYLTRADRPTRADWIKAAMAIVGPDAAISGWDAVHLRGVGSLHPPTDDILVITSGGANRQVGQIRVRPSARPLSVVRTRTVDPELPLAQLVGGARAVADTALTYRTFVPVRALVTSAVQRRLCTAAELAAELDAGPQNGSGWLRRALDDVFGGAASIAEAEAADLLRSGNLPRFELNVPILLPSGEVIAVADVLFRDLRAVLEVDSREHHFLERQWRATMTRHNTLLRAGLAIAHYPPVEFRRRGADLVDEVELWLRGRAREIGVPYVPAGLGSAVDLPPARRHGHEPTPYVVDLRTA